VIGDYSRIVLLGGWESARRDKDFDITEFSFCYNQSKNMTKKLYTDISYLN